MDEQRIWAPWRIGYIAGEKPDEPKLAPKSWTAGADETCFLCRAAADFDDSQAACQQNLVVWRDAECVVLLNRYPYNNGHLLIAPRRHVADLDQMTGDEHLSAMNALARLTKLFTKLISAEGFNVGLNLGRVAGAGVPGHLHWHLVPRWNGDNNFLPTVASTRVISQSLDAMWEALTTAIHAEEKNGR